MRAIGPVILFFVLAGHAALAGAELLLQNGTELSGVELERKGGLYLLTLESGEVLPVPLELVKEMRLTGDDDPDADGLEVAVGTTLVGPEEGIDLPRVDTQLAVLGEPAYFARGPVNPYWYPESDWDLDPANNNFNPARWYRPPIDPEWVPRSAYKQSSDVTEFNPVRWSNGVFQPTWWPRDGFGDTRWFEPVSRPAD
ncbi:MAG: hypothetical protein GY716_09775 [bacterium]|nr:hypothetical protein [bacterium]